MLDKNTTQIIPATTEEERPPEKDVSSPVVEIPASIINDWEKRQKEEENRNKWKLKSRSFLLLVICIGMIFTIYLLDSALMCFKVQTSAPKTQILDVFKSIIPLLIGYLFATETKSK